MTRIESRRRRSRTRWRSGAMYCECGQVGALNPRLSQCDVTAGRNLWKPRVRYYFSGRLCALGGSPGFLFLFFTLLFASFSSPGRVIERGGGTKPVSCTGKLVHCTPVLFTLQLDVGKYKQSSLCRVCEDFFCVSPRVPSTLRVFCQLLPFLSGFSCLLFQTPCSCRVVLVEQSSSLRCDRALGFISRPARASGTE